MNAPANTVPLVGSGTAGPLGALHVPRLWTKMSLHAHDVLAEGYHFCGPGFDQMTLDAFGLDRDETIAYFESKHPTYMEFETDILAKDDGSLSKENIEAHDAAIRGYNHSDELGGEMRKASGNEHDRIKDAVTLNNLEDLDELRKSIGH